MQQPAQAVLVVDALLDAAVRRRATALLVEPEDGGCRVTLELGVARAQRALLDGALGLAVVARLALLGQTGLPAAGEGLGRLTVRSGVRTAHFLAAVRRTPAGLAVAELRRMHHLEDGVGGDPTTLRPGAHIGSYRLGKVLGRGGSGVVFDAEHLVLKRRVAIKVLHARKDDGQQSLHFLREARAAARVDNPGIVGILDVGSLEDGRPYIVMERVEAPTLADVIQEGPLAPRRAVELAIAIADALAAAHAAGVVHRDLKPANVFVLSDHAVKLVDFGAAKIISPGGNGETGSGQIVGTPWYMSPEHARGQATDARTDIYALGCVLFEMLTGSVPFDGESAIEVLSQHLSKCPPPLRSPHGSLPASLHRTVGRAMAKQADNRHASAEELSADLSTSLRSLSSGWRRWVGI